MVAFFYGANSVNGYHLKFLNSQNNKTITKISFVTTGL